MNNEIRDARGHVIGYRCWTCGKGALFMWGETCNECREIERRHVELVEAIKLNVSNGTGQRTGTDTP